MVNTVCRAGAQFLLNLLEERMTMADKGTSDRRRQAEEIFAEAQQAYAHDRLAWAVEYAREALRVDGSYAEVRHWLAERYLEAGAAGQAAR
ncbi:unnamed protein product, partial [marine sediment metagenome]